MRLEENKDNRSGSVPGPRAYRKNERDTGKSERNYQCRDDLHIAILICKMKIVAGRNISMSATICVLKTDYNNAIIQSKVKSNLGIKEINYV